MYKCGDTQALQITTQWACLSKSTGPKYVKYYTGLTHRQKGYIKFLQLCLF
jgi:hypothetical protein